jgi:hypothetical protein
VRVFDGVTNFASGIHTGSGLFETLVVGTDAIPCVLNAAATEVTVMLRIVTTNQTVQFDNVRVYLRAQSFAECLRPDLYDGYTAIRTFLRQEDSSGSLFTLVADVHGLQPERNPVRAIRTLLSDATHGLGKAVDAASFDAAETAVCLTYEDAVRLDNPVLFLPFRDPVPQTGDASVTVLDRSSYANHGTAFNGGGGLPLALGGPSSGFPSPIVGFGDSDDASLAFPSGGVVGTYVSVPTHRAYSGQTITVECWLQIFSGNLPDATKRPIIEKLVGTATGTGYGLYRENNAIVFFVVAGGVLQWTFSLLVDVTDENRWIHVVGTAANGVLNLYRGTLSTPAVLVATDVYAGTIAEGDGEVLIGRFGGGVGATGRDWFDNFALYPTALPAARIAAHTTAIPLDATPVVANYMRAVIDLAPSVCYYMGDQAGGATMFDVSGNSLNGTYVGGPTMGVAGPGSQERGYVNGWGAVRFANDESKYAVRAGQTWAFVSGTVLASYAPAAPKAPAGICEKCIGAGAAAARDTQFGLCQRGRAVRGTLITSAGAFTVDAPVLPEDVGRYGFYALRWTGGVLTLFKNGAVAATTAYTGTPTSGVGDFLVGIQGTVAGVRTRPGQGDIGRVAVYPIALTDADLAALQLAATWYNGGLTVDAALTEPRAARAWLEQLCLLRGIRLGFTADGAITCTVDAAAPTTIRLHARDGSGDGERTLLRIGDRQLPSLDETVTDVVVKGRRDLLNEKWHVTRRRTVHADKGHDRVYELDCVREYPALDRVAAYIAATILDGEQTVAVTMGQEARQLMEAELLMVTDALMGYDAAITRVREITKSLPEHGALVAGWSEAPYTWVPTAYPSGAGSG